MNNKTIWQNADIVEGYQPSIVRRAACGHLIAFSALNDCSNELGWEVFHCGISNQKLARNIIADRMIGKRFPEDYKSWNRLEQ